MNAYKILVNTYIYSNHGNRLTSTVIDFTNPEDAMLAASKINENKSPVTKSEAIVLF